MARRDDGGGRAGEERENAEVEEDPRSELRSGCVVCRVELFGRLAERDRDLLGGAGGSTRRRRERNKGQERDSLVRNRRDSAIPCDMSLDRLC